MPKRTTGDRPDLRPIKIGRRLSTSDQKCTWLRSTRLALTHQCARSAYLRRICMIWPTVRSVWRGAVWRWRSTRVYGIPAYEILEQRGFEFFWSMPVMPRTCPGARQMSAMPHGCASSIPAVCYAGASVLTPRIATLRAYLRQRERLVEYAAAHIQHMQKALMEMNLQPHHGISESGRSTGL